MVFGGYSHPAEALRTQEYIWEGRGGPRPSSGLEKVMAKSSPFFSFLAAFLGATQGHFHGLGEQSDREKRDNPYFFCILSYKSPIFTPSMQMLQQLSLVKLLTVRVFAFMKICRLRNKASFKCLLFTKWLFYIWICWVPTTRSQWGAEGTQHSWELAPGCISIALSLLSILQIWLIFKIFNAWHRTFVLFFSFGVGVCPWWECWYRNLPQMQPLHPASSFPRAICLHKRLCYGSKH